MSATPRRDRGFPRSPWRRWDKWDPNLSGEIERGFPAPRGRPPEVPQIESSERSASTTPGIRGTLLFSSATKRRNKNDGGTGGIRAIRPVPSANAPRRRKDLAPVRSNQQMGCSGGEPCEEGSFCIGNKVASTDRPHVSNPFSANVFMAWRCRPLTSWNEAEPELLGARASSNVGSRGEWHECGALPFVYRVLLRLSG